METRLHRRDIDGLRAIAVLMVLIFHFDLLPGDRAGFIGVDVFFVISGFLITSIINRQLEAGDFSLGTFYLARVRRLAPALFITLLLTAIAGTLWLFPIDLLSLSKEVVFAQLYVANVYYWRTVNYFGLSANSAFLLHTWSLGVEEQFYVFYPIFLTIVHRHFRRWLWTILFAGLVVSFLANVVLISSKPEAVFYLLPTRAWELLLGAMVIPLARLRLSKLTLEILGAFGILMLALAYLTYDRDVHFPGWFALIPTIGAAAILLSGSSYVDALTARLLSISGLAYIGRISYPLYLVHWPITTFASSIATDYTAEWRILMLALSFAIAAAIYHLIERPIRERRFLASSDRLKVGYVAGLSVTLASFILVWTTGGLPVRFSAEAVRLASFSEDKLTGLQQCDYQGKSLAKITDFCSIGDQAVSPTWLVYGDSHAWAAHDVFDKWLKSTGQSGLFIFRHACPPLKDVHLVGDGDQCFAFNREILNFLDQASFIRSVALISTWRQAIEGRLSDRSDQSRTNEESVGLFQRQFSETIQHLKDQQKLIYIWEPLPGARRSVPQALARAVVSGNVGDIRIPKAEYLSTYKFFFDALALNRSLIERSFSPSKMLCSSGYCSVLIGSIPVYFDNSHITKSSTNFWVEMLSSCQNKCNSR